MSMPEGIKSYKLLEYHRFLVMALVNFVQAVTILYLFYSQCKLSHEKLQVKTKKTTSANRVKRYQLAYNENDNGTNIGDD